MRWVDVSVDGVWTIAAEDREKGNAGELLLPASAVEIIKSQPHFVSNPFVFAGARRACAISTSHPKAAFDAKLGKDFKPWVLHDLRRSARSLMSRAGVRPDIAERVMGHAIRGVEGVYDRHQYSQEKAHALEALAALIESIVNPPDGNVVQFAKGA